MDEDLALDIQPQEDAEEVAVAVDDAFATARAHYEAGEMTDEDLDLIADTAVKVIRELIAFFGETNVSIDEYEGDDGELIMDVSGGDLAVLIGRNGRTLDAFQMVLSSYLANKMKFHYPVVVDIEGYKSRRKEKVEQLARAAAARAKRQRSSVKLAPMNAYERRIAHLALLADEEVSTHSEGEDPERRVVITYVRQ